MRRMRVRASRGWLAPALEVVALTAAVAALAAPAALSAVAGREITPAQLASDAERAGGVRGALGGHRGAAALSAAEPVSLLSATSRGLRAAREVGDAEEKESKSKNKKSKKSNDKAKKSKKSKKADKSKKSKKAKKSKKSKKEKKAKKVVQETSPPPPSPPPPVESMLQATKKLRKALSGSKHKCTNGEGKGVCVWTKKGKGGCTFKASAKKTQKKNKKKKQKKSVSKGDAPAKDLPRTVPPSPPPPKASPPPPPSAPSPPAPPPVCARQECTLSSGRESPFCLPGGSPSADFECPAQVLASCDADAGVDRGGAWGTTDADDRARIRGYSEDTTFLPYARRATRRSSLDPSELVVAYDEVWTDGICAIDSWTWRPHIDIFHTLMGGHFLFRLYVLELGGPEENYARVKCDLKSWTNDDSDHSFWHGLPDHAKNGDYVQTIDNTGKLCGASDALASTQYRWSSGSAGGPSGQCQLYPGARYTTREEDMDWDVDGSHTKTIGQYIFTPQYGGGFSEFVHCHEMLHLSQNAQRGRRLYAEHGTDGECCTVWLEHICYVTYAGYAERLPERFAGLQLYAPWNGWRVDRDLEEGFASGLFPEWMRLNYPDAASAEAQQQKWHTATFVQSAYRAYTAVRNADGSYRNHLLMTTTCNVLPEGCEPYGDPPDFVWESLSDDNKARYNNEAYGIVFDITYRMRNLASIYFTHLANKHQADGFGAYEFFTYELQNPRDEMYEHGSDGLGPDFPSDGEMYGLAGFAGRREFLEAFHTWMLDNLEAERPPLEVAVEITQPHTSLLDDIERLKARNLVPPDQAGPRCGDADMPPIIFDA